MSAYTSWSFLFSNTIFIYSIGSFISYLVPYTRSTHETLFTFDDSLVSDRDQNIPTRLLNETNSFDLGDDFLVVFVNIFEIPRDFIIFIFLLFVLDLVNM